MRSGTKSDQASQIKSHSVHIFWCMDWFVELGHLAHHTDQLYFTTYYCNTSGQAITESLSLAKIYLTDYHLTICLFD